MNATPTAEVYAKAHGLTPVTKDELELLESIRETLDGDIILKILGGRVTEMRVTEVRRFRP